MNKRISNMSINEHDNNLDGQLNNNLVNLTKQNDLIWLDKKSNDQIKTMSILKKGLDYIGFVLPFFATKKD